MRHVATKDRQVAVIGGGIIGVAIAEALLRQGHKVTLIEPGAFGGEQSASYGNGAFISPASVIPMSMPGLWRQVPGYLFDQGGPLTIRWAFLPRLMPWLVRFLMAGRSKARVARTARALSSLLSQSPVRHSQLAARAGVRQLIQDTGLLYLYSDRKAFAADRLAWQLRAQCGVKTREVEDAELRALVPGLAARYGFGILLTEGQHCLNPGGYVDAVARHCLSKGASWQNARARRIVTSADAVVGVETDAGTVACDTVVVAAGIHSTAFSRPFGDRIPLESERGYHVEFAGTPLDLKIPVMPQDLKVAIVQTAGGLRVAGQVEFASAKAAPNWKRADLLGEKLRFCFPDVPVTGAGIAARRWQGNRPSTPDGLPVIGRARKNAHVFYAFGHGHVGLNAAPMTAELIADLVAERPPPLDITPFRPDRFR
ncbi:NAD(P)/FAD-dependent oxidoreductase [Actibacterium ureilyticum]|uniref:NAD(P)/FAD-dependent oxidoreductase n=1 Tax=Actibacterium ureilyticum TaxID=1590614 RepID=UPI000BAA9E55|nr:FAD-dependent oxidoreductase [Actibacterium ureilyticum]